MRNPRSSGTPCPTGCERAQAVAQPATAHGAVAPIDRAPQPGRSTRCLPISRQARCRCCSPSTARSCCATLRRARRMPAATYLIDVRPPPFFQAGPGGYDAVFSVHAKDLPGIDVLYSDRIDVHISGSALHYELDEPTGIVHWPVNGGTRRRLSRHQADLSRERRALHFHALRRAVCRVDRVPRRRHALPQDVLPRRRQGRDPDPQVPAGRRRHAAAAGKPRHGGHHRPPASPVPVVHLPSARATSCPAAA